MKIYLVGGAVRDLVSGAKSKDKDFVVVGTTEAEFREKFPEANPVGKAFQVWLIPGMGEVAFARKERKVSIGHDGFEVQCDASVTLEEDLLRRDLTINSMAIPARVGRHAEDGSVAWAVDGQKGSLIDPYGGMGDLRMGLLRATSKAFEEDPLRVYRLARFAATLKTSTGHAFLVEASTADLCHDISALELQHLSKDRIREEFLRAMNGWRPRAFVEALETMGQLGVHFEELARLRPVPAGPPYWHPEGDALTHTLLALDAAVRAGASELERVAVLFHDLGKGQTPKDELPSHRMHEFRGVAEVAKLAERIGLPNAHTEAAKLASEEHLKAHRFLEMRGIKMYDMVRRAERNPLKPEGLAAVAEADSRGRGSAEPRLEGPQALRRAAKVYRMSLTPPEHLKGEAIGQWMRKVKGSAMKVAAKVGENIDPVLEQAGQLPAMQEAFLNIMHANEEVLVGAFEKVPPGFGPPPEHVPPCVKEPT